MADPIFVTLAALEKLLDDSAHASYGAPQSDPFKHGCQVGECWGYQRAIQEIKNALSAGDEADAKL